PARPHRAGLVRGLRSTVHAPAVSCRPDGRRRSASLPVPQRMVRPGDGSRAGGTTAASAAACDAGRARRDRLRHRRGGVTGMSRPSRFAQSQRATIVNGMLALVVVVVVLQLYLLTASVNA